MKKISRYFTWGNKYEDIMTYVRTCAKCQKLKADHKKIQGQFIFTWSKKVNAHWCYDLAGLLPSRGGPRFLLLCLDSCERYLHISLAKANSWLIPRALYRLSASGDSSNACRQIVLGISQRIRSTTSCLDALLVTWRAVRTTNNPVQKYVTLVKDSQKCYLVGLQKDCLKYINELKHTIYASTHCDLEGNPFRLYMERVPIDPLFTQWQITTEARLMHMRIFSKIWRKLGQFIERFIIGKQPVFISRLEIKYLVRPRHALH